jgi:Kef-type K+ transport system membrane component KefB
MASYEVFNELAIIIVAAKLMGLLARKLHAPQVVGEIIAGLLVGPCVLGIVSESDFIIKLAEIGVIMLMFMAGLETDLRELMKTGPIALLIACAGVFVPLAGGFLLFSCFYGFAAVGSVAFFKAVFIGVILTATSVSITVETLREMGRLKGKVGTTILSAAIIDDVIGIIVLTFVIGFQNESSNGGTVIINTILFSYL